MEQAAPGLTRSTRINARERILEAASCVARQVGPAHLSLDAVAEQAGVSKGGLLYHFPTKQALITAIVGRYLAAVESAVGLNDAAPFDGDKIALGLLRACNSHKKQKADGGRGFLAAIAEDPTLLEPIREHHRRVVERLRSASAPDVALIAFFVVEGMRSLDLFDSNPLSESECEVVLGRLATVLRERSETPSA